MDRRAYLAALGASAAGALAGCSVSLGNRVTRSGTRTFDPPDAIAVTTTNGGLTVTGADVDDVTVDYRITGPSRAAVDATSVVGARDGGRLSIELARGDAAGVQRTGAHLDVTCPGGTALVGADTSNGAIEVEGVAGDPVLSTSNGRIEARSIGGTVTADTSNGSITVRDVGALGGAATSNGGIDVDVPAVDGDVSVDTSNGNVSAALAPDLSVTVTASTTNGSVDVSGLQFSSVSTGNERFAGTLGAGEHALSFGTSNGSIELEAL
ncbi:MAG: DUF4097 family beta strand repeat-containing protein [Haloarculaceae archaeon]